MKTTVSVKDVKKQIYDGISKTLIRFHILVAGRGYLVQKCLGPNIIG